MARFDRYIIAQLLVLFGLFALILVSIYWINRSVSLFDQLIANGQSALVFLQITALSLPNLVRVVLPLAGFATVLWGVNRLHSDGEFIIVQATGFSPWRLARPILIFGLILTFLLLILNHALVPASLAELTRRQAEIQGDLSARFLKEGDFVHPSDGITFFVSDIAPDGWMRGVFLSDRREPSREITYTAASAMLVRENQGMWLVMFDGMAQFYDDAAGQMAITGFEDVTYEITDFSTTRTTETADPLQIGTAGLLERARAIPDRTDPRRRRLIFQIHVRNAGAIFATGAVLVGFATLLIGRFSRFGLWRQVLAAVVLIVLVQVADGALIGAALDKPSNWPLLYVAPIGALALAAVLLWYSSRPRRQRPLTGAAS